MILGFEGGEGEGTVFGDGFPVEDGRWRMSGPSCAHPEAQREEEEDED